MAAKRWGVRPCSIDRTCAKYGLDARAPKLADYEVRLRALVAEGLSQSEIAHRLNRDPSTISKAMKRLGLHPNYVSSARRDAVAREEYNARLAAMVADGMSQREMAAAFGVTVQAMGKALRRRGLKAAIPARPAPKPKAKPKKRKRPHIAKATKKPVLTVVFAKQPAAPKGREETVEEYFARGGTVTKLPGFGDGVALPTVLSKREQHIQKITEGRLAGPRWRRQLQSRQAS